MGSMNARERVNLFASVCSILGAVLTVGRVVSELAQGIWHGWIRVDANVVKLGLRFPVSRIPLVDRGPIRLACLSRSKRRLGTLFAGLSTRRWWRWLRRLWLWLLGLRFAHRIEGFGSILLGLGVCRCVLLGCRWHTSRESRRPSLRPSTSSASGRRRVCFARSIAAGWRREVLCRFGPRIALAARGRGVSTRSAATTRGIVFCLFRGVSEDFMRGLDLLKLGVYFLLSAGVAVGVVFQSCLVVSGRKCGRFRALSAYRASGTAS